MGMFDEIICDYPLPGTVPEWAKAPDFHFQTKDLDCSLSTYRINHFGQLNLVKFRDGEQQIVEKSEPYTGDLDFYMSNTRGCAYGFSFTSRGEDNESVEWRARFRDGQLESIQQTEYTREVALPTSDMPCLGQSIEPEPEHPNPPDTWMGRELWCQWGSLDPSIEHGYPVKVLAETPHQVTFICTNEPIGPNSMETTHKMQWGRTLFASREAAEAHLNYKQLEHETQRRILQAKMDAKKAGRHVV
jgi:hypothetical protein